MGGTGAESAAAVPAAYTEEPGKELLAEFYAAAREKAAESVKPIPWNGEEG